MSEDDVTVPVVCPACDTETEVALSQLETTIARHNDNRHDGEAIAEVDPAIKDHIAELVADDLELLG